MKHFHSCGPWLLIMDNLGELSIIKQELLNLDPKLSLRAHIQPVTTGNSSTCPICQLSSKGTNLQFQLCIFSGVVNRRKSDRGALNRIQDLQLLMFADLFWEMDHWAIDTQMVYLQVHLPMPADDPGLQSLVSKLLQPSSTCDRIILAMESSWIRLPPWTFSLPQGILFVLGNVLITTGLGLWTILVSTRLVGKHQCPGEWCTVRLG